MRLVTWKEFTKIWDAVAGYKPKLQNLAFLKTRVANFFYIRKCIIIVYSNEIVGSVTFAFRKTTNLFMKVINPTRSDR
jgi:hypothetical protein